MTFDVDNAHNEVKMFESLEVDASRVSYVMSNLAQQGAPVPVVALQAQEHDALRVRWH